MSKTSTLFLLTLLILIRPIHAEDEFAPEFFAFQNGVHFKSPEERTQILKQLGYSGIGSANLNDLENRLKIYADNKLKIFSIYTGVQITDAGYSIPGNLSTAIQQLKGSRTVVELFVGGKGTDEQAVAAVREVASMADKQDLQVVLYPHTGCHVDELSDAVRIARKVDRKNVGVMFNLCHFLRVEPDKDLKVELEQAKPYLWRVSICGAEKGTQSWNTLIQPLDQGNFPQAKLLGMLRDLEYKGAIGLQCYAIKGDSRSNLQKSIRRWKQLLEEVNKTAK